MLNGGKPKTHHSLTRLARPSAGFLFLPLIMFYMQKHIDPSHIYGNLVMSRGKSPITSRH